MAGNGGCDSDDTGDEAEAEPDVPDVSLSLDAMLELLTHHHRREVLRFLIDDPNHTASIDELTSHLLDCEAERTSERPAHNEIETQLHHTHLPKLTDTGIVEYDARSQELRYWRHERLESLLEDVQSYTADTEGQ